MNEKLFIDLNPEDFVLRYEDTKDGRRCVAEVFVPGCEGIYPARVTDDLMPQGLDSIRGEVTVIAYF